jgi:hypothetical protein
MIENFLSPVVADCTGQAVPCSSISSCGTQIGCISFPFTESGCGGHPWSCSDIKTEYVCSDQLGCTWSTASSIFTGDDYFIDSSGGSGIGWKATLGIVAGIVIIIIILVVTIIVICIMNRRNKKGSVVAASSATPSNSTSPVHQQVTSSNDIENPNYPQG